jgi:hypothetical protein
MFTHKIKLLSTMIKSFSEFEIECISFFMRTYKYILVQKGSRNSLALLFFDDKSLCKKNNNKYSFNFNSRKFKLKNIKFKDHYEKFFGLYENKSILKKIEIQQTLNLESLKHLRAIKTENVLSGFIHHFERYLDLSIYDFDRMHNEDDNLIIQKIIEQRDELDNCEEYNLYCIKLYNKPILYIKKYGRFSKHEQIYIVNEEDLNFCIKYIQHRYLNPEVNIEMSDNKFDFIYDKEIYEAIKYSISFKLDKF